MVSIFPLIELHRWKKNCSPDYMGNLSDGLNAPTSLLACMTVTGWFHRLGFSSLWIDHPVSIHADTGSGPSFSKNGRDSGPLDAQSESR
jgi:hypothetical protein